MVKKTSPLELHVPKLDNSYALLLTPWPTGLEEKLPITVRLLKWKQEIYFSTPITPETYKETPTATRVERGSLYYWPPEQSLCIFYGISQIYTPGHPAGTILGPLHDLDKLKGGEEAVLRKPEAAEPGELTSVLEALSSKGYQTALVKREGDPLVAAAKRIRGRWVPLFVYEEAGYLMAESEPLFKPGEGALDFFLTRSLEEAVAREARLARLDVDEEGRVIISGVLEPGQLASFSVEYERLWRRILGQVLLGGLF